MTTVLKTIAVDQYVIDVLMRDLVCHDRTPSTFLVYLYLWGETERMGKPARVSLQTIAECTGLSKSAVQKSVQSLLRRKLLRAHKESATAIPEYRVLKPWRR